MEWLDCRCLPVRSCPALVKLSRIPLLDLQSALWADGETGPQAVAEAVAHNPGLSVPQLYGAFSTDGDALAAAVAEALVDLDDLSHCLSIMHSIHKKAIHLKSGCPNYGAFSHDWAYIIQ